MRYRFELEGLTPLLMHKDDVELADKLMAWRKDSKNKNISVAGDDRSPPWTWVTYLYHDGNNIAFPVDNVIACLVKAAARVVVKGQTTLKGFVGAGLPIAGQFLTFRVDGSQVPVRSIEEIDPDESLPFTEHKKAVESLGFELNIKRAGVGSSKHVRVRPMFTDWSATGEFDVRATKEITPSRLEEMWEIAGTLGLGDWRPSAPKKPGVFGQFTTKLTKIA